MRGSGWILAIFAVFAWVASVGCPAVAMIWRIAGVARIDVPVRPATSLLVTSFGWAVAVALAAVIVGWAPGRVLGRALAGGARGRTFLVIAALVLVPLCLPAYIVYYTWWQSWPAQSELYRWVVTNDYMAMARQATLFVGLVCWSWPLVSLCVAGVVAATPPQRAELMLIDGAGRRRRMFDRWRCDLPGLAVGGLLVMLATLANTTCFDLAEVFTYANELRAVQAFNGNARDIVEAALPTMLVSAAGAAAVWGLLGGGCRPSALGSRPTSQPMADGRRPTAGFLLAVVIWALAVVAPLVLFVRNVSGRPGAGAMAQEFFGLYGWSVANTLGVAAISGACGAIIAAGMALMWQDHRAMVRRLATAMAIAWLVAALVPGTVLGVALEAAYNFPGGGIYRTRAILVIGHLAAFGFIAALLARWLARREPGALLELRRLDGAQNLTGLLASSWPRLLAAGVASFAIIFVMAVGEIPVTAIINPPHRPGAGPLALTLLNDMHYQRPETVMLAAIGMIGLALLAALTLAAISTGVTVQTSKRPNVHIGWRSFAALFGTLLLTLGGCAGETDGREGVDEVVGRPLRTLFTFGVAGQGLGQFAYPRAIAVDSAREFLYVIDKAARVQRFGFDGRPQLQWQMPDSDNGKPTGVTVAADGRVFVADTHYFRVIAYDSEGNEMLRFGEFGRGPGQFIYVTDVAFGPDDRIYVAEYGGNDRVQVFDAEGRYLFEFGSFGSDAGQFNRPQAIVFNEDRTELYVADACNHRIVVVDAQGRFLRAFGRAGRGAGQLTYPYGLTLLADGSLLVAEFGNNRLQRFSRDGKFLGMYGNLGRAAGQLQYPWGVAASRDRVFVLDSGNNRVQVIKTP